MPLRPALVFAALALALPVALAPTADAARPLTRPTPATSAATPSRTLSLVAVPLARPAAPSRRTTSKRRTKVRRATSSARRARPVTALRDERDLPAVLARARTLTRTSSTPMTSPAIPAALPGTPDAPEQPSETVTPPTPPETETPPPTNPIVAIGASLREWFVGLSRSSVPAGSYTIQLQNFGEDPHDLVIENDDTGSTVGAFEVTPAAVNATTPTVASKRFTLAAGSYTLYCSLPTHRARGMSATLTVTDP